MSERGELITVKFTHGETSSLLAAISEAITGCVGDTDSEALVTSLESAETKIRAARRRTPPNTGMERRQR